MSKTTHSYGRGVAIYLLLHTMGVLPVVWFWEPSDLARYEMLTEMMNAYEDEEIANAILDEMDEIWHRMGPEGQNAFNERRAERSIDTATNLFENFVIHGSNGAPPLVGLSYTSFMKARS